MKTVLVPLSTDRLDKVNRMNRILKALTNERLDKVNGVLHAMTNERLNKVNGVLNSWPTEA